MVVRIVGKKKGIFPNDQGVAVEYAKLFCLTPPPEFDDSTTYDGLIPDSYSFSVSHFDDIPVDCDADIGTNSSGKIISLKLL